MIMGPALLIENGVGLNSALIYALRALDIP